MLKYLPRLGAAPSAHPAGNSTGRRLDRSASLTAHFVAFLRAAESLRPARRRMLDDRYSRDFAGRYRPLLAHPVLARAALRGLDARFRGLHAHIVLRVRYTDDVIARAVKAEIDQIVLLGAGFDTTSMRTEGVDAVLFEVDAPTTQQTKRRILRRRRVPPDPRVRYVACDFEHDQLSDCLGQAGFDTARPALILWIGVGMYLTGEAFARTLSELSGICAPGSLLVLDYIDPEATTGTHPLAGARRTSRAVLRRGEPYRTGFTPRELANTLSAIGFTVCDTARVPSMVQRYAPDGRPGCTTDDWLGIATAERIGKAS